MPNFKASLEKLRTLGQEIERYQNNCDTIEKAREAKRLITSYGKASESITTKNAKEVSSLSRIKGYYDPIRDQVRSLANRTIATFNHQKLTQEQQMREHLELIHQLKQEANHLFSRAQDAANLFLAVKNPVNMETLQKTYQARRRDLMAVIAKMPSDISGGYQADLSELNRQVNVHSENLLKQKEKKKAELRITIIKASDHVDGLTLGEMVKLLAPKASQQEVTGILNGKHVTGILGQKSDRGALILTSFPKSTQVQLIAAFMSELGLVQNPQRELATPETTALTQFAQALIKNAQELQEGKKQLLSLLSVEKGRVSVMHVNLQQILENPIDTITEIALQLYTQGSRGNVTMQLTSYREAAQLQELAGIQYQHLISNERLTPSSNSLADISSLVVASNPRQLTQITGNPSSSEALLKVEEDLSKLNSEMPSKGYTLSQMMDILRVLVIITTAHQMLMSNHQSQEVPLISAMDQARLQFETRQLTEQESNQQALLEQVARERAARLTNLVAKHKSSFDLYLKELKEKTDDLAAKGNEANPKYNSRYQKVGLEATLLFNKLEAAGKKFFDSENPATPQSYQQFVNDCFDSIANASQHFVKHRGLWNNVPEVLRFLMGIVLAIPVGIPALLTGYGSNYSNAFFRTPPTDASVKLEIYQDKLSSLLGDIERDRPELLPQAV